ncbi:hypothetical protein O6H91_08G048900 [Diphasiastrum complanatum]|uniref:Uncharacterized protein n=2 Tax=Diphasiastrum complanatum TaxID=34168 RepID=A0ACC2CYA1_DIPCM|nr:hypothetical protein O6H91_08G048900 [Diphasiastrum complanatum]KAJ7546648.1 hypothetical protein O6H91_08G048900 [Diphasiastrum complanatum]
MDAFGYPRKRPRTDFTANGNGAGGGYGFGSAASDRDLGGPNVGSTNKTKPACTKFFSTSGCPYGEECHFSHYVPGGVSSLGLSPLTYLPKPGGSSKKAVSNIGIVGVVTPSDSGRGLGGFKTRLCNKYGTPEGCRFGEKCHFAHGEKELRGANGGFAPSDREPFGLDLPKDYLGGRGASTGLHEGSRIGGGRGLPYREPTPPGLAAAASFGASSTAKISIDASLAGAIIGKSGINAKQICRLTGAKLSIRDHETDAKLKNVEMEGSFEQIKLASQMVRELLMHKDVLPANTAKPSGFGSHNIKTKMCENFPRGTCTFGDRCHFAHGANELREAAARS